MSGTIGNNLEPRMRTFFGKLLKVDMNGAQYGEFNIALLHFMEELSLSLIFGMIGLAFWRPLLFISTVLIALLIYVHEKPTEGRKIDVITRGSGQVIGFLSTTLPILHHYWWQALALEVACVIFLAILYRRLTRYV